MDERLNGTCWGEIEEQELLIPEFMQKEYVTQSLLIPASAYYAQGVGRAKHLARAEKKQRRDFKNGIAYMTIFIGLLVLANVMMEVICR